MFRTFTALLASIAALALTACDTATEPEATPEPSPTQTATAASATPDYAAVVADTERPAADRAVDAQRKPVEMLAFAQVAPGMKVFEMLPGGGYFTRLFAGVVGEQGSVALYVPDEMIDKPWKPLDSADKLAASMAGDTVSVLHFPVAGPVPDGLGEHFDLVWTSRNYHDFHNLDGFDGKAYNAMVLDLLKPGGTYIVLDHSAPVGSGIGSTDTTHRIDADFVRKEIESAGFLYDGASAVLANPDDTRDVSVYDDAVKGRTDQFVLRFRKPG